jgi:hypothetical protein
LSFPPPSSLSELHLLWSTVLTHTCVMMMFVFFFFYLCSSVSRKES